MKYRNWTLCDPSNTILPHGVPLTNTMPMDRSAITISKIIDNSDFKPITPAAPEEGPWVSTIDKHCTVTTIPIAAEWFAVSKHNSVLRGELVSRCTAPWRMSCYSCGQSVQVAHIICFPSLWSQVNLLVISVYSFPVAPLVPSFRPITGVISGVDAVIGIINLLRIWSGRIENLRGIDIPEVMFSERRRGNAGPQFQQG